MKAGAAGAASAHKIIYASLVDVNLAAPRGVVQWFHIKSGQILIIIIVY